MKWVDRFVGFYLECEKNIYKTISGMFGMRFLTWVAITIMVYKQIIILSGMEYVLVTTALVVSGVYKKVKEIQNGRQ